MSRRMWLAEPIPRLLPGFIKLFFRSVNCFHIKYHNHIWQVWPQLCCGDNRQIHDWTNLTVNSLDENITDLAIIERFITGNVMKVLYWTSTFHYIPHHKMHSFVAPRRCTSGTKCDNPLQWRHDERDGVSNHQPLDCLLSRLFRSRSKKISMPRVTGLCAENSPVTGKLPAQMAINAENVSIWWRHHALK